MPNLKWLVIFGVVVVTIVGITVVGAVSDNDKCQEAGGVRVRTATGFICIKAEVIKL